jgi:uncharacterized protein YxjI
MVDYPIWRRVPAAIVMNARFPHLLCWGALHGGKRNQPTAMNATVQERRFSFTAEYDITVGESEYFAHKKFFSFNDKIHLERRNGNVLAKVNGTFSPMRARHDICLSDGRTCRFWREKIWKQVYVCTDGGQRYRYITHRGLRSSMFRDDRQIAALERNRVVYGKGERYDIRMDSDADAIVVLCIVLTINTAQQNDKKDAGVTIDFGNIGPQERAYDPTWQPR